MHGLINCALQDFATEIYGASVWQSVHEDAKLEHEFFETMLVYDDAVTEAVIKALSKQTGHARDSLLEDFGTYLASEHASATVMRLLRLGGEHFDAFLEALCKLHDHLNIAIPELEMPLMHLERKTAHDFGVHFWCQRDGYGEVFLGLIRAMADQYGVLVTVGLHKETQPQGFLNLLKITLFDDCPHNNAKAQ